MTGVIELKLNATAASEAFVSPSLLQLKREGTKKRRRLVSG